MFQYLVDPLRCWLTEVLKQVFFLHGYEQHHMVAVQDHPLRWVLHHQNMGAMAYVMEVMDVPIRLANNLLLLLDKSTLSASGWSQVQQGLLWVLSSLCRNPLQP